MRLYTAQTLNTILAQIATSFAPSKIQDIPLLESYGRILAKPLWAQEDIPAFNRSTVDGYGVSAQDTFGASQGIPGFLTLAGQVKMGEPAPNLKTNQAIYVPTGGMVPMGADGVIMLEDTELLDNTLNLYKQIAPGENVITQGEDCAKGQLLIPQGKMLKSGEIGILAALGYATVSVFAKPKLAILSTGDELLPWSTPTLPLSKIRDANGPTITCLSQAFGGEATYLGICPDDYSTLKATALKALAENDILVLSGGSSVGTKDYTPQLILELCNSLLLEGLAIQPGKPSLLGKYGNCAILGLPGHPLSALNVFSLLGKALIDQFGGLSPQNLPPATIKARLTANIPSQPGRLDVVRVQLAKTPTEEIIATPVLGRSALLRSLRQADGTIKIAENLEGLTINSIVEVEPLT